MITQNVQRPGYQNRQAHGEASALALAGYGMGGGWAGDLVLVEGENVFEAVVNRPPRKVVVKAGLVVARDGVAMV